MPQLQMSIHSALNFNRSDDSDGEIDDAAINRILIVTQTPPALRKHPQGDRTGDFLPRAKMTADLAKVINDGLFYYEQDLWDDAVCSNVLKLNLKLHIH